MESPFWAVVDLGAYLLSRAGHLARRALGDLVRRRRLVRLLRDVPVLTGSVVVARPVLAPLSGESVAACRVVVERARDDGTWAPVLDQTRIGELEIRHPDGCTQIEGPLVLVRTEATHHTGAPVRALLGAGRREEDEDLRASEYLLLPGERVHLLGIALTEPDAGTPSPYRARPPRATRTAEVPMVVITPWSWLELQREIRRRPELLPRA